MTFLDKYPWKRHETNINYKQEIRVYYDCILQRIVWYWINHHHHVAPSAQIFLTISHYPSLSFLASCRSSELHPVSTQTCCMKIPSGSPAFARPCEGVHKSTSHMSSSLFLQQSPACLVRLILIVFVMGGWWRYHCCFVGCCLQDLFSIARNIFVYLPSSIFFRPFS